MEIKLVFYPIKEGNMGIPYVYWKELQDELKPYVSMVCKGILTKEDYFRIRDDKYDEFLKKYGR